MKRPTQSGSSDDEKIVQRGDHLSRGSRQGSDRRTDDRGLNAGRRMVDHRRVRTAFVERIQDMVAMGISAGSIARILNDEDIKTARGEAWTESAIQQLLEIDHERSHKAAWSPFVDSKAQEPDSNNEDSDGEG